MRWLVLALVLGGCGPDPAAVGSVPEPTPGADRACADLTDQWQQRAKGCDLPAPASLDCASLIWWDAATWPDCLDAFAAEDCSAVANGPMAIPVCASSLRAP